ncbi:hypothetical protein [Morganella psychrotolerans]|uniref:COG4648 family protein n=1 Tax=Morganella psychrotolerans TaxID=368603 RepID=UPI0039AFD74E
MRHKGGYRRYVPLLFRGTDIVLMILWPFVVLYLLYLGKMQLTGAVLLGYFVVRFVLLSKTARHNKRLTLILTATGVLLCALSILFKNHQALMYYPVAVNVTLLAVFSYSLYRPPSVIEQLARLQTPDLSPYGQRYTFRVTQVWCLFFILNGTIALLTTLSGDVTLWAWWNGFISYLLIGLLFAGEWCVRRRVQRNDPQQNQHKIKS